MTMDNYQRFIVKLLQNTGHVTDQEPTHFEFLKTIGNDADEYAILSQLMEKGDISGIRAFTASSATKDTYDDYTWLLIGFSANLLLVCVWDSDELYDNPELVAVKNVSS